MTKQNNLPGRLYKDYSKQYATEPNQTDTVDILFEGTMRVGRILPKQYGFVSVNYEGVEKVHDTPEAAAYTIATEHMTNVKMPTGTEENLKALDAWMNS